MTLTQLRYFQQLTRTQHFHQAADSLYISQPSLSRAISQLEQELGVALFEKRGRNVSLTPEGKLFLEYVERALEQLDQGIARISSLAPIKSSLSLGCVLPAVSTYLSPLLQGYQRSTGVSLRCRTWTGPSLELLEGMINGTYDMIFCSFIPNTKGVQFVPVCSFPFCVVMRKDDPLSKQPYVTPEQLRGRTMLFTELRPYADLIREILDSYKINPIIGGLSNDETVLLGMVQAGLGIFISTDYPQIHSEDISLIPLKQDKLLRTIFLAICEDREYSPEAKRFIEYTIHSAHTISPIQKADGDSSPV